MVTGPAQQPLQDFKRRTLLTRRATVLPFWFFQPSFFMYSFSLLLFSLGGGGRVTLSLSLIGTKQNHMSTVYHRAHVSGEGAGCVLRAKPLDLVGASQPPVPNLVPGHFTEEEAEVQGSLIRVTAGLGSSSTPFRSLFWRCLSRHGVLRLKPQRNQSFLEHLQWTCY